MTTLFVWLPMSNKKRPKAARIMEALGYMTDATKAPVLLHCRKGSDRTGLTVAAYRMTHDHWTEEQALEETHLYGHGAYLSWWDDVLDEFL